MLEESVRHMSGLSPTPRSGSRSDTSVVGPRKKTDQKAQLLGKMTLGDGLICVDFLSGPNILAIGSTKAVHLVEVTPMNLPSQAAGADASSTPQLASVSFAMRSCGMFGNVAKVEALAWYPNRNEAVLAIVQLSRSVTVLFDALSKKGDAYMAQQWIHSSRSRTLVSSTVAGSEPLSAAVVSAASMPSTPFGTAMQEVQPGPFVERDPDRPCSMVEVVINTGFLRVERITWDPHNPYTLALTSNATHFELWTIPLRDKKVYPPRLILRPPAHDERSVTRGVVFSPFDPNLIVVVVERANAGKVIVYDRRHVEVLWSMETTGPCLSAAFHPIFSDLLAVSFRKAKTKTNSRVQFFRVQSDVIAAPSTTETNHSSGEKLASAPAPLESTDVLPPIDSIDSLNRLRWRPCGNTSQVTGGEACVETSDGSIDATSSKLWFATTALNGQEISVWDAANGFSPIFSIRTVSHGREFVRQGAHHMNPTLQELPLQEPTDCVWVNALTLVSIFKDGGVVLTSLLDEKTTSRDTLFRCITDPNTQLSAGSDVLSLSAILPTAAVVADYFGRSFAVRSSSSLLREYYTKIINAEKRELLEELASGKKSAVGGGGVLSSPSPSSTAVSLGTAKHHKDSSRATPTGGMMFDTRYSPLPSHWSTQTPLQQASFERRFPSSLASAHAIAGSQNSGRRLEFLFPLLFSLVPSPSPVLTVATTTTRAMGADRVAANDDAEAKSADRFLRRSPYLVAFDSRHRSSRGGLETQSESGLEEKACSFPTRHGLDGAAATAKRGLFGARSASANEQSLSEYRGIVSPMISIMNALAMTSSFSPTQSEEGNARRTNLFTPVGRTSGGAVSLLQETQVGCANLTSEYGADGGSVEKIPAQPPPLGRRSLVKPVIDCFVLSNETCGWAYVEQTSEEDTFVRYALNWEMGFDTSRKMRAHRHAATEEIATKETENVDQCFARMMGHNSKVCRSRERELQAATKAISEERGNVPGVDGATANSGKGTGNSEYPLGSVDPRGRLWAAAAYAWRSHNVTLITSLVCSYLEYTSLVGDVQFCAVLYLLFCLWWKQRGMSVRSYACPLFPTDEKPAGNAQEYEKTREATNGSPWQWKMRALQWIEQYVTRLYEIKLYVPLNELLIIVPEVMGNFSAGLPRAEDVAQKLFTCVYCGTCPKSELVPRPPKKGERLFLHTATPATCVEVSEGTDERLGSDDDSSDSFESSLSSSHLCMCVQDEPADSGACNDSVVVAKEKANGGGSAHPLANCGVPPRNAVCSRCRNAPLMTCVICEEVVEGMYLWLLSCGHGGHVHHIKEWLEFSNECPRCGIPVLHPAEQLR
ncbi:WD40 repeat-containing protein [Trypanosoma cruzi cruzi]|nr:WD40 repeat-containing protein [Trypanosoma cruzi cruzi]